MLRLVSSASKPASAGILTKVTAVSSRSSRGGSLPIHTIVFSINSWSNDGCSTHIGRRTISSTSPRHADITLTVDGTEVTVPQGMTFCHELIGVD